MSQSSAIPFAGQADFLAAAQALLPPGAAWPREADAMLTNLLTASTASLARVHARCADLSEREAVPFLSEELLSAWEAEYGLPDPCTPLNSTVPQRQAAVLARMASTGGSTAEYFINVAAALGYTINITTFSPAQCGVLTCGAPLYGAAWLFVWQVNAPGLAVFPFLAGSSRCGDPLNAYSGSQLSCVLNRIKPAYSILIINY